MKDANLFQLGIGLETGAHEEGSARGVKTADIVTVPSGLMADDRLDHFIHRDGVTFAGTHLIVEVIQGTGLDDEGRIQRAFREMVEACKATLLHIHTHKFSPQGVSGVAVLSESHISVHTWPEIGYGAFDIFMCGDAEPWRAVPILKNVFATDDVRVKELRRGECLFAQPEVAA
ncbi:adenosylmethionine decarboxylase [Chachezhania sediminis]|uniref:adenosylmethionine decarboxylase n=1 Tax=Chachezhania sediminis TaxID=2599291 RepID=UPI00131E59A1|nr:adenosylmethionine decarboxylase [Chachezhania sediminis]